MEGTDYLIHPVGDLRVYERGSKARYGSSSVIDLVLRFQIMEKRDYWLFTKFKISKD
jgi:hypothetical protein